MAMNLYITGLIGTKIITSALYYFSRDNLTLYNYKEFVERYGIKQRNMMSFQKMDIL